jgi:hypothetical protein
LIEALIEKKAPFVSDSVFFWHTIFYDSRFILSDFRSCISLCQNFGATDRKSQIIGSGKANYMVTTAIYFKSPGIISPVFFSLAQYLNKIKILYRQLDGSSPTVVLMELLNLLGAVSLCKGFSSNLYNSSWCLPTLFVRICWPIAGDQPAAAAHLTENLNVAFELFQVRTGEKGLEPLARNGFAAEGTREAVGVEIRHTIDLCRSKKGQVMRSNAEQLKLKFAKAWEEDGTARQEIRKFIHKYTSALL